MALMGSLRQGWFLVSAHVILQHSRKLSLFLPSGATIISRRTTVRDNLLDSNWLICFFATQERNNQMSSKSEFWAGLTKVSFGAKSLAQRKHSTQEMAPGSSLPICAKSVEPWLWKCSKETNWNPKKYCCHVRVQGKPFLGTFFFSLGVETPTNHLGPEFDGYVFLVLEIVIQCPCLRVSLAQILVDLSLRFSFWGFPGIEPTTWGMTVPRFDQLS